MSFQPFSDEAWSGLSQEARDAAYDNRAAVKEADTLIASRNEASRQFRSQTRCHLDLPYGNSSREAWDIFPAQSANAPCLVFIHGGYWQRGDRKDFSVCARGALLAGWSAALCGYPLAPDASLSEIVSTISSALDWLKVNGRKYGVAGPIILSGWSAGGHLAAVSSGHPSVVGALCISGLFELAPLRDTYLNEKLHLTDEEIATLSPMRRQISKPIAIAYGTDELPALQGQSSKFHAVRAEAGLPGRFVQIQGANHFSVLKGLSDERAELMTVAQEILNMGLRRRWKSQADFR